MGGELTKRRIEINVDKRRVLLLQTGAPSYAWCVECGAQVAMLSVDEAAMFAEVTSRAIYRQVESGKVHYNETPRGLLRICANSLRDGLQSTTMELTGDKS